MCSRNWKHLHALNGFGTHLVLAAAWVLLISTTVQGRSFLQSQELASCHKNADQGCHDNKRPPKIPTAARQAQSEEPLSLSQLLPLTAAEDQHGETGSEKAPSTASLDSSHLFSFETNSEVNTTALLVIKPKRFPEDKPICRIQGICRSGDGSYLLPVWMKQYSGHIDKCGLPGKQYYVLEAKNRGAVEVELSGGSMQAKQTVWTIRNIPRTAMTLSEEYSQYDLIGGKAPRELLHWLVTDTTPSLYMMDLSARFENYQRSGRISQYACTNGEAGENGKCDETAIFPAVKPMVLVDGRVSSYKSHHWPQGYMRLMRNSFGGDLKVADATEVYGWKLRSQASCFRSVIATKASVEDLPSQSFDSEHILWKENGLTRRSVHAGNTPSHPKGAPCVVKTLLLNKYGKRFMVGHDKLRMAIEQMVSKSIKPQYPHVRLLAETVFFENSSFHEQVSVMQESNIVVAAHGSSNANVVFLRPDSTFIEVMPFGLEVDTYRNLAKAFDVQYKTITAQPDEEVFKSCVKHYNPSMPPGVLRQILEWEKNAKAFQQATIAHGANPTTDYRIPVGSNDRSADHLRLCTTYQRLSFNIDHVAAMVAREALAQCAVGGALSSKQ